MTVNQKELEQIALQGETEAVEFKKSTAQLRRAMETLCGMLNGHGGRVLFGIAPQGQILGQEVSDKTLREVADQLRRFEPPATIAQTRIELGDGKQVLVLEAQEDLKRDHPSKPRNPLIARVFYLRGIIERWGRGTEDR